MAHDSHAHDGHDTHHSVSADRSPAFLGLIVGGLLTFVIMYAVVAWTNTRFEGHSKRAPAAGAPAAGASH